MFIELVDLLRCPRPHDETWLVASSERMDGRDIVQGVLGCPICRAEYPIENGVALFGGSTHEALEPRRSNLEPEALAAFLGLTDSSGVAVLVGGSGHHGRALHELTGVQLLLANPPNGIEMGNGLSGLTLPASGVLPLATRSVRGVALDHSATPELADSVARALRPNGRLLIPTALALPDGLTPLARDESFAVAERSGGGLVELRRK
jgi:uncharacterized protein YbaR (Trm112 family)